MMKSIDAMKLTQDRATNPPSDTDKAKYVQAAKDMGAEYFSISTPYDTPSGGPDATTVTTAWVTAIRNAGLNVWHRHSWLSDEGWYGVAKDNTNDRIADTKSWILSHPSLIKPGDIFCPKPEPQNMGIMGVNTGSNARFGSAAAFNSWLRLMTTECNSALSAIGSGVKAGYWGFDGFITCGYGNPDWQGKSFLEPSSVAAMGNMIAVDHYPSLVNKPMTDFLKVFKATWPGVFLTIGENGSANSTDPAGQFMADWSACLNDSLVNGYNYWQLGPDGGSEKLLNVDLTRTAVGNKVKELWVSAVTIPPEPPTQKIEIGPEKPYTTGDKTFYRDLMLDGNLVGKIRVYRKV